FPQPGPPTFPQPGNYPPVNPNPQWVGNTGFDTNDVTEYLWLQSKGGNPNPADPTIDSRYARPGAPIASAGANEFDAFIATGYIGQFKGYALGLDTYYNQGDNFQQISQNLANAMVTPMAPEA